MNRSPARHSGYPLRARLPGAVLSLMLLLFTASVLRAQETSAIVGTVMDPSGAVVPGAKVTLINEATQFTRVIDTNNQGQYVASAIPTGSYDITVVMSGFKQVRRTGVQLAVASTQTVDFQLSLGEATQTTTVTGTAPLLQMQSASLSGLVDNRQMVALPLVSRDFTDLVLLTPGAHLGTATTWDRAGAAIRCAEAIITRSTDR